MTDLVCVDNVWKIEGLSTSEAAIQVNVTDPSQTVQVVNCKNIVVQIINKLSSISISNCQGVGAVFDNATECEISNCKKTMVQVTDNVNTISVSNCDNITLYVSEAAVKAGSCKVLKKLSVDVKIVMPPLTEDGDSIEILVPEQFVTKLDKNSNKLVSTVKPNKD